MAFSSQACQQQASRRGQAAQRPAPRPLVRGKRTNPSRFDLPPPRHRQPSFPVDTISTIGTIRNTLHDIVRDLEDYPEVEGRPTDTHDSYISAEEYDDALDTDSWDQADDEDWGWPADHRWRPVALFVGAIAAIGAIATAVIINSGDSATTKATVGAPTPRSVISTTPSNTPSLSAPPTTSHVALPPETVTTLTPGNAPTKTATAAPAPTALPPALPGPAGPPRATVNPRTVVYNVTGTKQMFDLVNIAYTDARGFPVTEFNVALPWTKVIVLNPGVQTESVIATSIYGQLNCAIFNAEGQVVKASANNSALATCTR